MRKLQILSSCFIEGFGTTIVGVVLLAEQTESEASGDGLKVHHHNVVCTQTASGDSILQDYFLKK